VKLGAVPIALSPQNPRLGRVRELGTPRGRREQGRFVIEGPTLLAEARRSTVALTELYVTEPALDRHRTEVNALEADGIAVYTLPERVLARLSELESPPGLLAVAEQPAAEPAAILGRPGPVLLLCGVNDPGNAGALVRSAEAFGAAGVLFGRGGVDPYGPKVVRAAMGSLFRLPIATVSAEAVLEAAAAAGRSILALVLDGEPLATALLPADPVLAVGNERHGVAAFLPRWDRAIRIEHAPATESLNAAVAGSIALYALARRDRPGPACQD
jgi:TrmH family RNA methyltransferase